ncbi:MAG: conjugal transfer protein TraN, partial [Sphingomonas sp.]
MRALVALIFLTITAPVFAQTSTAQARADGKTFGEVAGKGAEGLADTDAAAVANLDAYRGASAPESAYLGNPAGLDAAAITTSRTNEGSVLVIDGDAIRPKVPKSQIDETVATGDMINQTPDVYARGVDPQGTSGTCVPLPPSTSSPGNFEATCNVGEQVINEPRTCNVPLEVKATSKTVYDYTCSEDPFRAFRSCDPNFTPRIGGSCTVTATRRQFICRQGFLKNCTEPDWITVNTLECDAPVPNEAVPAPRDVVSVTAVKNESICTAATQGLTCTNPVEVCTDSTPTTRMINNVPVTQACWGWQRTSQCQGTKPGGNDCSALDGNPACKFDRTECLDDPRSGPCKVEERIYICPIPGNTNGPPQMLCGGDVYCIGSECEAVTREASDEFKDAAVGMESLAQVNREFDSVDYKLFKGTAMSCHKPIFGLVNCCAGKTSGLIPAAAGFAALAAGPAAIAGLATPFL